MRSPWRSLGILLLLTGTMQADGVYFSHNLAGTDSMGDGGSALQAVLRQAEGLAADASGNIYVADAADNRVRRITPDGMIGTVAGTGAAGQSGDGGPATAAQLNSPYGVAVDATGNIYIADLGNAKIRKVSADGIIHTIAGGGSTAIADLRSTSPATDAKLNAPRNVAVDRAGTVYFSDFGLHQIFSMNATGSLTVLVGNGKPGDSGDGGPALSARLNFPAGLAIDNVGTIYIADSGNARIRKVAKGQITSLSSADPKFTLPTGLGFDITGALIVADAVRGQAARLGSDGVWSNLAAAGRDVVSDPAGALYFSKGKYVLRLGRDGLLATMAGSGQDDYIGEGVSAILAKLQAPAGAAIDASGNLYFADSGNNRIRQISPSGAIRTIAGTGEKGYSGDGAAALLARLNGPMGVTVDGSGNIYFTDTGNHVIRRVDPSGNISAVAGKGSQGYSGDAGPALSAELNGPTSITMDRNGNLVFADTGNHAVRRVAVGGIIQSIAGGNGSGFDGDGKPAIFAMLNGPEGVAYDKAGNLWISDTQNHQIRQVDYRGTIRTIVFSSPSNWKLPRGLAVDDSGTLYIAASGQFKVFSLAPDGTVAVIAGNGTQGNSDTDGAAADLPLNNPVGLAIGAKGALYVTDSAANRIKKLSSADISSVAGVTALNGASYLSQPVAPGEVVALFGTNIGPATPQAGALDSNNLYTTKLASTQVLFDGIPAPLFYANSNQINLQAPYEIAGRKQTQVQIKQSGAVLASFSLLVNDSAPGIFADRSSGQCIAVNQDGSLNSASNGAQRGSVITLYVTGEGQTDAPGVNGKPADVPYPQPKLATSVEIGGAPAQVVFSGEAPGMVGLLQLNVRVPSTVSPGTAVPITVQVGAARSQAGVKIAVR